MNVPGEEARFPRDVRLCSSAEYGRVFARPRKSADPLFTVLARRSHLHAARLGLVVSKKHVKLAVQRNRIKRLIRESFRRYRHILCCQDLVVMARHGTAGRSNEELFHSLRAHWDRLSGGD